MTLFAVTLLGETARQSIVRSKSGLYIARLLRDADTVMPHEIKSVLDPYLQDFDHRLDPTYQASEAGGGEPLSWDRILRKPSAGDDAPQGEDSLLDGVREDVERTVERGVEQGSNAPGIRCATGG